MTLPALKLCTYCGQALPDDRKARDDHGEPIVNIEHVFPDAVGGTLVIPVHRKCNSLVNKLVDEPFTKSKLLEWFRCNYNIEGSRGRGAPSYDFELPSNGWGPRIIVRCRPDGTREVVAEPRYEKHPDGVLAAFGTVSTDPVASHAEAVRRGDEWAAKVMAGAVARGQEAERLGAEIRTEVVRLPENPPPINQNTEIVLRELAKIALGVSAWYFGDAWIAGESASLLRAYVRGERTRADLFGNPPKATAYAMPSTGEAIRFPHFPDGYIRRRIYRVASDEHAFGFFPRASEAWRGTWCVVQLFGFVGAAFRVLPSEVASDEAWALGRNESEPRPI